MSPIEITLQRIPQKWFFILSLSLAADRGAACGLAHEKKVRSLTRGVEIISGGVLLGSLKVYEAANPVLTDGGLPDVRRESNDVIC